MFKYENRSLFRLCKRHLTLSLQQSYQLIPRLRKPGLRAATLSIWPVNTNCSGEMWNFLTIAEVVLVEVTTRVYDPTLSKIYHGLRRSNTGESSSEAQEEVWKRNVLLDLLGMIVIENSISFLGTFKSDSHWILHRCRFRPLINP